MNPSTQFRYLHLASSLLGAGILLTLAGCYNSPPARSGYVRASSPVVLVDDDSYVYYPGYEVYYNNRRREYVYRDNNVWVTRREPPRAWARELPASPSVRMEFRDAPERHHEEIVRTYPKNWRPPAPQQRQPESREDHRDRDEHHDNDDHKDRDDHR